jgi:hypothetical protein
MFGRERRKARLDPVRWRQPGRAGLVRLGVVALLLAMAAAMANVQEPQSCPPASGPPAPAASPVRADATRPKVPAGAVGVPVRLGEPAALAMVQPGDRVDLLAVRADATTRAVASDALVLSVGAADDPSAGLFLALHPAEARKAVGAPADARFAVLVRPAR